MQLITTRATGPAHLNSELVITDRLRHEPIEFAVQSGGGYQPFLSADPESPGMLSTVGTAQVGNVYKKHLQILSEDVWLVAEAGLEPTTSGL